MSNSIFEISNVVLNHDPNEHPHHLLHKEAAQKQWVLELEKKPELFDGQVMLFTELEFAQGELLGTCHTTPYSTFLNWRLSENKIGCHLFGMCLLVSKEGYPLVGQMADHTFHSGKVYAPSGSLDSGDLKDGKVDIFDNMRREIWEETGLHLEDFSKDKTAFLLDIDWRKVFFCRYFSELSADELTSRAKHFIDNDPDAELSDIYAIRQKGGYAPSMEIHMPTILDWHFDNL